MKSLEEFKQNCSMRFCNRYKFRTKNCSKEYRQKNCYDKYVEKLKKDELYHEFRIRTWIQDCGFFDNQVRRKDWRDYCKIWNILSFEQKKYIEDNFRREIFYSCDLDVCHIVEKARDGDLILEEDNAVVCNRYFHNLLDGYKNPVTKEDITKEERLEWFKKAKETKLRILG